MGGGDGDAFLQRFGAVEGFLRLVGLGLRVADDGLADGDLVGPRTVLDPVIGRGGGAQTGLPGAQLRFERLAIEADQKAAGMDAAARLHQNFADRARRGDADRKRRASAFNASGSGEARVLLGAAMFGEFGEHDAREQQDPQHGGSSRKSGQYRRAQQARWHDRALDASAL